MDTMEVYAYLCEGEYYCTACLANKFDLPFHTTEKAAKRHFDTMIDHGELGCIHEDTFQYEQYLGEIIPIDGIFCCKCDDELYAPMDIEEE